MGGPATVDYNIISVSKIQKKISDEMSTVLITGIPEISCFIFFFTYVMLDSQIIEYVIGATSGIGRACANMFASKVYTSSR